MAPGHAGWAPLTAGLLNSGVGRVLRAESPAAVDQIADNEPPGDLALVSMSLRGKRDRVIRRLRAAGWQRVLPLTDDADSDPVLAALLADTNGMFGAPADAEVARQGYDLSRKQLIILHQVARGRSIGKIGKDLGLSTTSVKAQLRRIAEKLGNDDLITAGLRTGLIR